MALTGDEVGGSRFQIPKGSPHSRGLAPHFARGFKAMRLEFRHLSTHEAIRSHWRGKAHADRATIRTAFRRGKFRWSPDYPQRQDEA